MAIALHNYFHLISKVRENEFTFDRSHFLLLLGTLRHPWELVPALFSYFGHYGVQLFIFITAYGLATKYWDSSLAWMEFVWGRIKKIYPMFLLAAGQWIVFRLLYLRPTAAFHETSRTAASIALTGLGLHNLIATYRLPPIGPWWFLPFIMQFYCLWPALRWLIRRWRVAGLVALSALSLALTYWANAVLMQRWSINLLETPIGHMPELCLGIAAARYGFAPRRLLGFIAAGLFVLSSLDSHFWLLSFVSALVLMLAIYDPLRRHLRRAEVLAWYGAVSMPLFLVNGFLRRPFVNLAFRYYSWPIILAFGIADLIVSTAAALVIFKIEKYLRDQTARNQSPATSSSVGLPASCQPVPRLQV